MVKATGPPDRNPSRLRGGKVRKSRKLLKELDVLLGAGEIAPDQVMEVIHRGKGKGGRGRPPLDSATRTSVIITLRLTVEQRDDLRKLALRKGEGLSAFTRNLIVDALARQR